MSNSLAMVVLFAFAGLYTIWQRASLRNLFNDQEFDPESFQGMFRTGAIMTISLVINAITYMKTTGLEYEMALYDEVMMPDGTIAQVDPPNLLLGQFEVLAGTYILIAIVWRAVRVQGKESMGRGRRGQMEVMAEVVKRLMPSFWLAALGIGSIFGVSAGFGFTDVLNHAELLLGPPLILAVELTIMWLIAKFALNYID